MTTLTAETFNRLQNIVELPRDKREEVLAAVLNGLPENQFNELVNVHLSSITPQAVHSFGIACFDKVDTRPNPPDGYITIDEVAEFIGRSDNSLEQAVLLYIWLHFEEIRDASDDFQGVDKAFDYVLTRKDFEKFQ